MVYFYCKHINIYLHSYTQKNNILENLICLLIPSTKGTKVSPENFGFPPQKPSSVFPTQIHLFPGNFFSFYTFIPLLHCKTPVLCNNRLLHNKIIFRIWWSIRVCVKEFKDIVKQERWKAWKIVGC